MDLRLWGRLVPSSLAETSPQRQQPSSHLSAESAYRKEHSSGATTASSHPGSPQSFAEKERSSSNFSKSWDWHEETFPSQQHAQPGNKNPNQTNHSQSQNSGHPYQHPNASLSGSWDTGDEIWNAITNSADRHNGNRVHDPASLPYMISMVSDASHIICSTRRKFVVLVAREGAASGSAPAYEQIGHGSGCEAAGECITACLCIPIYIPASKSSQANTSGGMSVCFAVGYSTGYLRVFDKSGSLLISQQLHGSPVQSIKLRVVVVFGSQENDEILVSYSDRRAVSIDGTSFYVAIQSASRASNDSYRSDEPSLSYKKWMFQSQEHITDIVSCGPAPFSTLFGPQFNRLTGNYAPVNYTARYVAVGNPMVALYATTETSRSFLASIVASKVTTAVTSAVFSFAKSLWSAPGISGLSGALTGAPSQQQANANPDASTAPQQSPGPGTAVGAPSTPMPAVIVLQDTNRRAHSISIAPPSQTHPQASLAVMSDSLGRVMLLDTDEGDIVRIWKGMRDAQTGWIQVADNSTASSDQKSQLQKPVFLILAIYITRGVLELYLMRHRQRICVAQVGAGMRLVQTCSGMLGGMYWRLSHPNASYPLSTCYLVSPDGEMRRIEVSYDRIASLVSDSSYTSLLQQLGGRLESASSSNDAQTCASIVDEMARVVRGLPDETQKLRALSMLPDAVPVQMHLDLLNNVVQTICAENNMSSLKLWDTLCTVYSQSAVSQQSREIRNMMDAALRKHLLDMYNEFCGMKDQVSNNKFSPKEQNDDLEAQLAEAFSGLENISDDMQAKKTPQRESKVYNRDKQSGNGLAGPQTFVQAFTINRRWIPPSVSISNNASVDDVNAGSILNATLPLKLADELDQDAMKQISDLILSPFMRRNHDLNDIIHRMLLSRSDWMILALKYIKTCQPSQLDIPYMTRLAHILLMVMQTPHGCDTRVLQLLMDYGWSTKYLHHAVLVTVVISHALQVNGVGSTVAHEMTVLNLNLKRTVTMMRTVCTWKFYRDAVCRGLFMPWSALDLGRSERTSLSRLVAMEYLRQTQSYMPMSSEIIQSDTESKSLMLSDTTSMLYSVYQAVVGQAHRSVVTTLTTCTLIHLIFEYIDIWTQTTRIQALQSSVMLIRHLKSMSLQTGVCVTLFTHCFATKLMNLMDMADRHKRVPDTDTLVKVMGVPSTQSSSAISVVKQFLVECGRVLDILDEPDTLSIDDVYQDIMVLVDMVIQATICMRDGDVALLSTMSPSTMSLRIDVTEMRATGSPDDAANASSVLQRVSREYLDDAFGLIVSTLDVSSPTPSSAQTLTRIQRVLDTISVTRHILMTQILVTVFQHDIRPVRPRKMFTPDTIFGGSLIRSVCVTNDDDDAENWFGVMHDHQTNSDDATASAHASKLKRHKSETGATKNLPKQPNGGDALSQEQDAGRLRSTSSAAQTTSKNASEPTHGDRPSKTSRSSSPSSSHHKHHSKYYQQKQHHPDQGAMAHMMTMSDPKISSERISFVAKIAEVDRVQAKLIANAFGLQGDRIVSSKHVVSTPSTTTSALNSIYSSDVTKN